MGSGSINRLAEKVLHFASLSEAAADATAKAAGIWLQ
jgi:hypothetical protein